MVPARWRNDPARLRRRLLMYSAPIVLLLVVVIVKSISVVIAGQSSASAYTERNRDALGAAVRSLMVLNVAEPAKAYFAAGSLAVLDDRLEEADREFTESLTRTDAVDSCPTRVNLELVRETRGDRAIAAFDAGTAISQYRRARAVVDQAPQGCFAGNTDSDPQRRALRADALTRLDNKIAAAQVAPPPPQAGMVVPPTPQPSQTGTPPDADRQLRLHPETGTPLERLQQILRDAAVRG